MTTTAADYRILVVTTDDRRVRRLAGDGVPKVAFTTMELLKTSNVLKESIWEVGQGKRVRLVRE